jgi:hypothetical protein
MDIKELKQKILEDTVYIQNILETIGCHRITKLNSEFRCARNQSDTNATRVSVKLDENISSRIYDLIPIKGDIFTLIMELQKISLSESIKLCCGVLGIKHVYSNTKPKSQKKAFGGFYKSIQKENNNNSIVIKTHSDEILNHYQNWGSIRFYNDRIEYDVQTDFDIMYDPETNRILVPWRDVFGNIIGIMGRYNASAKYCEKHGISKWLPLPNLNFPKSQFLYGLYQNYKYILEQGVVYVGESEKFVLQARSFGIKNTVAIGSHDISETQRKILLSLGVDIITCLDEGIPDEFNVEQCKKLKSHSSLIGGKVGFAMVDGILESKESPSDRGIEIFEKCVEPNNIFWV